MPLPKGKGQDAAVKARRELWASYKRTGKINNRKMGKEKARQTIEAIVHSRYMR